MFYLPYPPKEKTISAHAALAQLNARMNERANHPLPVYEAPKVIRWLALGLPPIYKTGTGKAAA